VVGRRVLLVDGSSARRRELGRALVAIHVDVLDVPSWSYACRVIRQEPFTIAAMEWSAHVFGSDELPRLVYSPLTKSIDEHQRAIDAGAITTISAPTFSVALVASKVRALSRLPPPVCAQPLEVGPLRVDLDHPTVHVDGRPVKLTRDQHRLLTALARAAGRIVSFDDLARALQKVRVDPHALGEAMRRLRARLGPFGRYIRGVFGRGFMLAVGPGVDKAHTR